MSCARAGGGKDKLNGSAFDRVDWPWANCQLMATLEIQDEIRPLNISREPNDLRGRMRSILPRGLSPSLYLCPRDSVQREWYK